MRILLLQLDEILGGVFPFAFEHVETPQLKSRLRYKLHRRLRRRKSAGRSSDSWRALDRDRLAARLLRSFESTLRNFRRFLHQLILGKGKRLFALIENLVSQPALNVLQRRQWTAKIKLPRGPTAVKTSPSVRPSLTLITRAVTCT